MVRVTGQVQTQVTYLEMNEKPRDFSLLATPAPELKIVHIEKPAISLVRFLYDAVGREFTWTGRKLLKDEELMAIVHDPRVETHVLYHNDKPAGYIELDGREPFDMEIAYFGLLPHFRGRGYGPYLLNWSIDYVFETKKAKRYWLHTCDLDDPRALPTYLRAGFVKTKEETEFVSLIE